MSYRIIDRPLGYKVGLATLVCAWFFFLLGYAIPAWHKYDTLIQDTFEKDYIQTTGYISGLWGLCKDDFTNCEYYMSAGDWLYGVRVLMSFAFIGYGVCCGLIIWLNFCRRANNYEIDNRSIEICCFITGALILIGDIVYAASIKNQSGRSGNHIGWAFAVNCIGAILTLLAGLLITVSHGKPQEPKSSGTPWPYGMGVGLNDSFQQDTQFSGFPEIDNPSFTDSSAIRFTRTTRPSSSSNNFNPQQLYASNPSLPPSFQTNSTTVEDARRRDNYKTVTESLNTSTGQVSEHEAPPSYYSVISSDSGHVDLGDGQSDPYSPQRPIQFNSRRTGRNEVDI